MRNLHGQHGSGLLLLHGGCGPQDPAGEKQVQATTEIVKIGRAVCARSRDLAAADSAMAIVVMALEGMESSTLFNAGYGSALQADGQARLTASLMDGTTGRFSAVILADYLQHPSHLARHLQGQSARVVGPPGTHLLARELGEKLVLPQSPDAIERWLQNRKDKQPSQVWDTVGCVALTPTGQLAAGTSTGGRGHEFPGRISDCGTVAGNYASSFAAISATGIGEEIVDDGLAVRMETRCRDGLTLQVASKRAFDAAVDKKRSYGWIGVNANGAWVVDHTTPSMTFVVLELVSGEVIAQSSSASK